MNEQSLSENRFIDLSKQADRKGVVCFSDFLTLNELNILEKARHLLYSQTEISGGYENAERQIAAFIPDALYYTWEYPIDCIRFAPTYPKFADVLSHRDILGAIMNLGIERSKIGDILVKSQEYFVFCKQELSHYIIEELTQIRHTVVTGSIIMPEAMDVQADFDSYEKIIASNRLDSITAAMAGVSRSQAVVLIHNGKIYINGAECLHNTYICKPNDVISIRGTGKFIFDGISGETRKNRIKISYRQYK